MDLYKVFSYPFKLSSRMNETTSLFTAEYYRFKTELINAETNKEEIYVITKLYFDNFVEKFKNYQIGNENITESSFGLYVEIKEDYDLSEKHIYSLSYNNIKNYITVENKFTENLPIEGEFKVCLSISCYVSYEEFEDEEPKIVKKPVKEDECVICYENKPNILFPDCLHVCICLSCEEIGNFNKCPIYRNKIINEKILI